MELQFEKRGSNAYLVYELKKNEMIDSFTFGMITNNRIKGISPLLFIQMQEVNLFKFDISGKLSLRKLFSGIVNKKLLLDIFLKIIKTIMNIEEYMIDINTLLLNKEVIFIDKNKNELLLICLPVQNKEELDMAMFFKELVTNTQFDQSENCNYVSKITNYLNEDKVFSIVDFNEVIENIAMESTQIENTSLEIDKVKNKEDGKRQSNNFLTELIKSEKIYSIKSKVRDYRDKIFKDKSLKTDSLKIQDKYQINNSSKCNTNSIESKPRVSEFTSNRIRKPTHKKKISKLYKNTSKQKKTNYETKILRKETKNDSKAYLIRLKNREKIYIDKSIFRIGKEKKNVDYFIDYNSSISRKHANIITEKGNYKIIDTNSKNHTYIDGIRLESNVETNISSGQILKLSNEEFEFTLNE